MSEIKLCKDCNHNRRDWLFGQQFAKCAATVNAATGEPRWSCESERWHFTDVVNNCGSTGKLWEPKPISWFRKLTGAKP